MAGAGETSGRIASGRTASGGIASSRREVCVSGIGLLSCLGAGGSAHFEALTSSALPFIDEKTYAPYPIHPLGEVNWEEQIKRRDMRQMGLWQQIGTYAAGLALEDAGAKDTDADDEKADDNSQGSRMDMIVCAGGGERDLEVDDEALRLARDASGAQQDAIIADYLCTNLRPTLFLAQLSNLLAGNISIVHKVTGSSRTFMGEEGSGIAAIHTACARIASGQSDIILVGGSLSGERPDSLLAMELGGCAYRGAFKPIMERIRDSGDENGGGSVMGSIGAFLVLESAEHAETRQVRPYCAIKAVESSYGSRAKGEAQARLARAYEKLGAKPDAVLSGATGLRAIGEEEYAFLDEHLGDCPVRAYGTRTGHGIEAHFPLGIALGALALRAQKFYPPFEKAEREFSRNISSLLVTGAGSWNSEGLALLQRCENARS